MRVRVCVCGGNFIHTQRNLRKKVAAVFCIEVCLEIM